MNDYILSMWIIFKSVWFLKKITQLLNCAGRNKENNILLFYVALLPAVFSLYAPY